MASVKTLVLASTSPFRRQILASAGVQFQAVAPEVDEALILPTAAGPGDLARRRGEAKAMAVSVGLGAGALVIGADQVLSLSGATFDKVRTPAAAAARLAQLSGQTHYLHSGVSVAHQGRVLASLVVDIAMPMRVLGECEISAYVATGEWEGSVGCYQFENRGVHLFTQVHAEASAIVGLPLLPLLAELRRLGLDLLVAPKPPWDILV